jgi:hypothetical protein
MILTAIAGLLTLLLSQRFAARGPLRDLAASRATIANQHQELTDVRIDDCILCVLEYHHPNFFAHGTSSVMKSRE